MWCALKTSWGHQFWKLAKSFSRCMCDFNMRHLKSLKSLLRALVGTDGCAHKHNLRSYVPLTPLGLSHRIKGFFLINPRQSHAEDHSKSSETRSRKDHCWGTSRLPPRMQHYRADLQPQDTLWEVPPTPNRTSIMSSLTSKRHSTGCGTQHFGQLWGCTISIQKFINAIQNLYDKASSAVCFNGSTGNWFRTTVEVRQGCLLSPTLFNIFLERIMADALEDHKSTVSIGGRTISNLRFADDIDGQAGSELV